MKNKKIGITFSQPHLEYLGIPIDLAIKEALKYNFSHIRLGAYWNRLEASLGHYDFRELLSLLNHFEKAQQPIILTLGVKAPRWPEFYWPDFIINKNTNNSETQTLLLRFIKQVIEETKSFTCITHWQIENEPLDPSGPENLTISKSFLKQEIELLKQLDSRPVIINLWGNDLLVRGFFENAAELADEVGIDLYYKQFFTQILGKNIYRGPSQKDGALNKLIKSIKKPVWITELQAEPWEKNEQNYLSKNPGSINPEQLKENILRANQLPVKEILLWGFEYWLWRKQQGDNRYLEIIRDI